MNKLAGSSFLTSLMCDLVDGIVAMVLVFSCVPSAFALWLLLEFPASRPVTFPEFLSICSRKYGILPDPLAIERAFNVFDRNSNGRVVLEDVLHTMTTVGDKLTVRSTTKGKWDTSV